MTLAPGILNNIFDGIERPLERIADEGGVFITRGVSVDSLDMNRLWETHITVAKGEPVHGGTVIAEVQETRAILHKCMVPPDVEGTVVSVATDGEYTIHDVLVTVELADGSTKELTMTQRWPIRVPRPTAQRFPASVPLVTGQRILDTMFPIAKGGTAAIPGGFGTGKTMTQHQIAKWADADIIIYIGCGERGNEMTQVLEEFSELVDPKTGNPLMDRTTLIANTSNMPVAAREASIYTGLTLAEYYRDMGYDVAIMADSTSRWAEALRELSGRLEEMPAEEGFRLGFLQQNAFHKDDTCVSMEKQFRMMDVILHLYRTARHLVAMGQPMSVLKAEGIFEKVIAIKYDVPNDNLQLLDLYKKDIDDFYNRVIEKNA